jgi:hypothetical protein
MKINKAKLLVGTLAIASVAATVGSISGTVAWFQYSTRSTVALEGAAAHCSESLQVRLHQQAADAVGTEGTDGYIPARTEVTGDWSSDLTTSQVTTFLSNAAVRGSTAANTLIPVTSGSLALGETPDNLYRNPIYQYEDMATWRKASPLTDYIELPLEFRVIDLDGKAAAAQKYLAKDLFLSDLTIVAKTSGKDISKAVRVAVDAGTGASAYAQTFALSDGASTPGNQSVDTHGKLDLNNDGEYDTKPGYDWQTGLAQCDYGNVTSATNKAVAQRVDEVPNDATDVMIADDSDPYAIKGKPIGKTIAGAEDATPSYFAVKIRIYLEGWARLPKATYAVDGNKEQTDNTVTDVAVWDIKEVLEANFYVGMRFSVPAHNNGAE